MSLAKVFSRRASALTRRGIINRVAVLKRRKKRLQGKRTLRTPQPARPQAGEGWWEDARQIAKTVYAKLFHASRLDHERRVGHDAKYYIDLLPGVPVVESPFFAHILALGYFDDWEKPIAASVCDRPSRLSSAIAVSRTVGSN